MPEEFITPEERMAFFLVLEKIVRAEMPTARKVADLHRMAVEDGCAGIVDVFISMLRHAQ